MSLRDNKVYGPGLYMANILFDSSVVLKVGYTEFHPYRRMRTVIRAEAGCGFNLIRWYTHVHARAIERELKNVFSQFRAGLPAKYVANGNSEGYDADAIDYIDSYINVMFGNGLRNLSPNLVDIPYSSKVHRSAEPQGGPLAGGSAEGIVQSVPSVTRRGKPRSLAGARWALEQEARALARIEAKLQDKLNMNS